MKINLQNSVVEIENKSLNKNHLTILFSLDGKLIRNKEFKHLKPTQFNDLNNLASISHLNDNSLSYLILSLGESSKLNLNNYLKALGALSGYLKANKKIDGINLTMDNSIAKVLEMDFKQYVERTIFHMINFMYYFDERKTKRLTLALKKINIISDDSIDSSITNAISLLDGIFLLKHLANNPANYITPTYLADVAKEIAKSYKKVKANILNEAQIKKLKMGAFLSIAKGSSEEPKFITLQYQGGKPKDQPIVIVGKGITFDSGGISLKPRENMHHMKFDMCGAATVLGTFLSCVKLELPINLNLIVPTCENMPSGRAIKPGDIVTSMSGKTIEVVNTDAEGRMILCDALTYAKHYNPKLVIDMATLTGASTTLMGKAACVLYSNDNKYSQALIKSGEITADKAWQMPLFEEYLEMLTTNTDADLVNIGSWSGAAGTSTAAMFLSQFADYPWVHLDIANVAMGKSHFDSNEYNGASGRPFFMLMDFLRKQ